MRTPATIHAFDSTAPSGGRSFEQSGNLHRLASGLLPGGVPAGCTPLLEDAPAPLYFSHGKGGRIWDVDGNEYIDFIMAYGAVVLGYARPEVDAAAWAEVSRGMLISLNHPLQVRFLDAVLRRFPAADRGYFMKTGSEVTTAAVRLSRRFTGRPKVIRCGFHGWHEWCFASDGSAPEGLAQQVVTLDPINPGGLAHLFARHRGEVAAVIVAPEMVLPLERPTLQGMIDVAHANGALFILDEIKTGFRTPGGSVQHLLDVHPDLTTLSKALGNGWPVSAVIGRAEVIGAGQGIHLSATFHGETAAMAAALANLEILERQRVPEHLWRLGQRLIDGLNDIARRHGTPARAYGEPLPMMPFLAFTHADEQVNRALRHAFYAEMFQRGVLLHPRHLWYTCFEHTDADIEHTLAAADAAMALAHAGVLAQGAPTGLGGGR